jgi:hypothetical protein
MDVYRLVVLRGEAQAQRGSPAVSAAFRCTWDSTKDGETSLPRPRSPVRPARRSAGLSGRLGRPRHRLPRPRAAPRARLTGSKAAQQRDPDHTPHRGNPTKPKRGTKRSSETSLAASSGPALGLQSPAALPVSEPPTLSPFPVTLAAPQNAHLCASTLSICTTPSTHKRVKGLPVRAATGVGLAHSLRGAAAAVSFEYRRVEPGRSGAVLGTPWGRAR